jgi:hypothetical protein
MLVLIFSTKKFFFFEHRRNAKSPSLFNTCAKHNYCRHENQMLTLTQIEAASFFVRLWDKKLIAKSWNQMPPKALLLMFLIIHKFNF